MCPLNDLPREIAVSDAEGGESVDFVTSLDQYCTKLDTDASFKEEQALMRKKRGYMDLGTYTDSINDYLGEYICKDEWSANEAGKSFRELVKQSEPNTSFRSLALKLQMKSLKHKQISLAESRAVFLI